MKRVSTEISPGFAWVDPTAGHVVACGDARDLTFVRSVTCKAGQTPDLLFTDPPYAVSSSKVIRLRGRKDMFLAEPWDMIPEKELEALLRSTCATAARLLAGGNVFIWTSDWFLSPVKRWLRDAGFTVRASYVWCKPNPPQSIRGRCFVSACEFMAVAQGASAYFDLKSMPRQRSYFVAHPDGEWVPAVCPNWVERSVVAQAERIKRADGEDLNRAQKPLDVTEALLRAGCPEGGLVLDLFGGTGTTLVAADRAGRRCAYVERDPAQVRAAASRLLRDRRERGGQAAR